MKKAYRFEQAGWTYVHLEGSPQDIGYQHGYLLAPEIRDTLQTVTLEAAIAQRHRHTRRQIAARAVTGEL